MSKIKICVIGLGSIGRRHLRLLSERDDVILCVADPSPKSKEFMAENYPNLPLYDSMQDAIAEEKPDAALIATPHQMHSQMAIDALDANLHVFCEKPMSDNLADCVKMLNRAKQSDRVFSVGFMFHFDPFIRKMKELINDGKLGNIVHFTNRFSSYNILLCSVTNHQEHTPYSVTMDCIHDTDLMYFLTNSIPDYAYTNATKAGNMELSSPQNIVDTLYRWEDGSMAANCHFDYVQHPQVHNLEIAGDKGYVKGEFATGEVVFGSIDGTITKFDASRDFDNVYREQLDHFIRATRGEAEPENKPESAIVSILLLEAQKEAGIRGCEVSVREIAKKYGFEY